MNAVLRRADGATIALDVHRWRADPDPVELAVLRDLDDPVLDIGCGPGRIPAALAAAGRLALGIDPAPAAAAEAERRGAPVLQRSVFTPLPGEGRWGSALLLDGNIGIGGDPVALLGRIGQLLRAGGGVVAEVEPPGSATGPLTVRLEVGDDEGPWFPWAVVGADAWSSVCTRAGIAPVGVRNRGGRWFAKAVKP